MTTEQYNHAREWARGLSLKHGRIIVALLGAGGVWDWRDYSSPAQARLLFSRSAVGHRGFSLQSPIFIAWKGIIMAQRRITVQS